tara:strand:- start:4495 stop:4845 length:351 start_codon:yes stop_codon:yes gene_type:complete
VLQLFQRVATSRNLLDHRAIEQRVQFADIPKRLAGVVDFCRGETNDSRRPNERKRFGSHATEVFGNAALCPLGHSGGNIGGTSPRDAVLCQIVGGAQHFGVQSTIIERRVIQLTYE